MSEKPPREFLLGYFKDGQEVIYGYEDAAILNKDDMSKIIRVIEASYADKLLEDLMEAIEYLEYIASDLCVQDNHDGHKEAKKALDKLKHYK
jgi:hypothetical protein